MRGRRMNKKITYPVTVEKIEKIKGDFIILHGGRATGKSYSVKYKVLRDAYRSIKDGICTNRFIYLRRYYDETKDIFAQSYFADIPIKALTEDKYNTVIVYRHEIFLGNIDENGKETKEILIGRVCALSYQVKYKSQVFKDYKTIVFEEFINDSYIQDETNKLFNFCSTVFRNNKGVCYMVGNLISRFNPYFRDWNLKNAINQKVDTIDTYIVDNVIIKCWMCPSALNNKMVFGHSKRAVDGVEYETSIHPHLKTEYDNCNLIYTVVLKHNSFMYLCELLQDERGYLFWYIQPKTTPIQKNTRVITKDFNTDTLYTTKFLPLNLNEQTIFDILKQGKVCFSDNLTGTEFTQIIDNYI